MRILWIALVASALTAACSTMPLNAANSPNAPHTLSGDNQRLIAYNVPRARLTVDLVAWSRLQYEIRVYEPALAPDPRFRFYLDLNHETTADDAVRVDLDPSTGLLRGINVIVDDRTTSILEQVAGAVGGVGAAPRSGDLEAHNLIGSRSPCADTRPRVNEPVLIARTQFDPLDANSITRAQTTLRAAAGDFALASQTDIFGQPVSATCATHLQGELLLSVRRQQIPESTTDETSTDVGEPIAPSATVTDSNHVTTRPFARIEDQCAHAVCAPSLEPYTILAQAPDGAPGRAVVTLPNAERMVVIDVRRAHLVRATTQATFRSGLVQSVTVTRPSETLAVVSLPITVLRAILGAASEVIQLRINIDSRDRAYVAHTGTAGAASGAPGAPGRTVDAAGAPAADTAAARDTPQIFLYSATRGVPFASVAAASTSDSSKQDNTTTQCQGRSNPGGGQGGGQGGHGSDQCP
jgi:hypothetical protein